MNRTCGGCTLCCSLLPVRELLKGAGERCQYQRAGKGCKVYTKPKMPISCRVWTCRWLANNDTAAMSRPDRSRYVIDIMPDFITLQEESGPLNIPVIQIWCHPSSRDAHRDPDLRAYLERRGKEGFAAIIRYNENDAFVLVPPALSGSGEFVEITSNLNPTPQHTPAELIEALASHVKEQADATTE